MKNEGSAHSKGSTEKLRFLNGQLRKWHSARRRAVGLACVTAKTVDLYGGTGAGPNVETPHSTRSGRDTHSHRERALDRQKPFDARRDAHIRNPIDSETSLGDV
jgi:hypothetical protein